jgi:hypothetical protein
MVCAFIDTLCKYKAWVMRSLRRCSRCGGGIPVSCGGSGRLVVEVGWRRCDGRESCGWGRLTALLLGRLLGVLLFTEARLVRRAVQWRPMKPESWSGCFPLKSSSPTCSCCWFVTGLQNVPRAHADCTGGMCVLTGLWYLADWSVFYVHVCCCVKADQISKRLVTIPVLLRLLVTRLSSCFLDTGLGNLWEVPV